jgi:hypothetical protein
MGCDIHAFLEIKHEGKWRYAGHYEIDRDYRLFTLMANVRNYYGYEDVKPIDDPRGWPDDIDKLTEIMAEFTGVCDHSHSYLESHELKEIIPYLASEREYSLLWELEMLIDDEAYSHECGEEKNFEDYRLIFAFDN